jgi:hypothetical protein
VIIAPIMLPTSLCSLRAHEAAVAFDIGAQDGAELVFKVLHFHGIPPFSTLFAIYYHMRNKK